MRFAKRRAPVDFGAIRTSVVAQDDGQAADTPSVALEPTGSGALQPLDDPADPPATHAPVAGAKHRDKTPAAWPIWLIAVVASALWALAPIAFAIGYRNKIAPFGDDMFALAVLALLAIGPAALMWACAYMIRQGQKLAFHAARAEAMAQDMLAPALVAAARSGQVTDAIRTEIARTGDQAEAARETLVALHQALSAEIEQLAGATDQSARAAQELAGRLGHERGEMAALAQTLDAQSTKVVDAISQQAKMVADAAGLAETQIREAQTGLSARAADLAAAAGEASAAARVAGEDLTRHIARLETAGGGVADQVRAVEAGLTQQRTALVALSGALKADHGAFAEAAQAHAAELSDFIAQARLSASELQDQAAAGGEALRQLVADAAARFGDLAHAAQAERDEFGRSTLQSFEAVASAAGEERAKLEAQTRAAIEALGAAAEETRAAAARHAAMAREQVDQLSEAAFTAGQKANQVFEARLDEARALVEQSSKLVEDAGAATARKLEEGAGAARATLDELGAMLSEIETRAARLPVAAQGQADQVRAAMTEGVEALMEQARRTAEEAQAIDAAFQARVRRNFEMLSDAVRLMGTVAAASSAFAPESVAPSPVARAPRPQPEPLEPLELDELASVDEAAEPPGVRLGHDIGLRRRLRLAPTATDMEFSKVFEAAGGVSPDRSATLDEEEDGAEAWTWKDLLASLEEGDGEGERLETTLADELARMGIDPAKLLPAARIEEIGAAVQAGDDDGAREVVRGLAPTAVRRIARRLLTDREMKGSAEVYVRRYRTLVDDARIRGAAGALSAELLGNDAGRLYLLLDAASGSNP